MKKSGNPGRPGMNPLVQNNYIDSNAKIKGSTVLCTYSVGKSCKYREEKVFLVICIRECDLLS